MTKASISLSPYGTRAKPIQIGERFTRWTVIGEAESRTNARGHRQRVLLCQCDCGTRKAVMPATLRNGSSRSCGCLQKEVAAKTRLTHGATIGYALHPCYNTWLHVRSRCRNPKNPRYEYYGGRGIDVCDEWFDSFAAFLADMGERPSPQHSIERLDNERGYGPDNCVWADKKTQARNTRRNRWLVIRGERRVLAEVAEASGLHETVIRTRIKRGWSLDEVDQPRVGPAEAAKRATTARWKEKT